MNFETYWKQLVDRVYDRHEVLSGKEELFYRWSCIYGETMVDGIEAYFDRRFDQFDADMDSLRAAGFSDVTSKYQQARKLMFGDKPLKRDLVEDTVEKLLTDESNDVQRTLTKLDKIYRQLIPRLEELADHKYEFGLRERLYSESLPAAR